MAVPVLKLHGVKETLHALGEMPRRLRFRHLRIALNAGGGVLKRSAQGYAPKETGLLKRSMVVKVKIPDASYNAKHHGKPAYVVVGPKRGMRVPVARNRKGALRAITEKRATTLRDKGMAVNQYRSPSRYAHLVHGGTRKAKANPYLTRAVHTSGQTAQDAVVRKLKSAIAMEAYALART